MAGMLLALTQKIHAGSLTLEDIQGMRSGGMGNIGIDADAEEKILADQVWKELLTLGYPSGVKGVPAYQIIKDRGVNNLLNRIGLPVCETSTRKNIDWRIGLLNTRGFKGCTWGGGVIMLSTGLLNFCKNEEEFAGVIAHEVGHNEYRHAQKRMIEEGVYRSFSMLGSVYNESAGNRKRGEYEKFLLDLNFIALKGHKRIHENEADAYIVKAFLSAGYDVQRSSACSEMLVRLGGTEKNLDTNTCLYRTHPINIERLNRVRAIQSTYSNKRPPKNTGLFEELKHRVNRYTG